MIQRSCRREEFYLYKRSEHVEYLINEHAGINNLLYGNRMPLCLEYLVFENTDGIRCFDVDLADMLEEK